MVQLACLLPPGSSQNSLRFFPVNRTLFKNSVDTNGFHFDNGWLGIAKSMALVEKPHPIG